jgi:hypothetical protein
LTQSEKEKTFPFSFSFRALEIEHHVLTQFGRNIKPCVQSHTRVALALAIAGLLWSAAVTMSQAAYVSAVFSGLSHCSICAQEHSDGAHADLNHATRVCVVRVCNILPCREDFDQIRRTTGLRAGEVGNHFHMAHQTVSLVLLKQVSSLSSRHGDT